MGTRFCTRLLVAFAVFFIFANDARSKSFEVQSSDMRRVPGRVILESSDAELIAGFKWAKELALSYAHSNDQVGDWYYSVHSVRVFCSYDLGHNSIGGQVLGLESHNKNMLRKFAENISDGKEWASYNCIDGQNKPYDGNYRNDQDFTFDMPGNFDTMLAAYRQFLWTGDRAYLNDPVFTEFYRHTVTDYVKRWDRDGDGVMGAEPLNGGRGFPSNNENAGLYPHTGADLIAGQYAGYLLYSKFRALLGDTFSEKTFLQKASRLKKIYNTLWWDERLKRHHSAQLQDGSMYSGFLDADHILPFWFMQIPEDGRKADLDLDFLQRRGGQYPEIRTSLAWVFYLYGRNDAGYRALIAQMRPDFPYREYPEVPFTAVGNIAEGLMGLAPDAAHRTVETLPRLTRHTEWVTLRNVPIFENEITVEHTATTRTRFTNQLGPAMHWKASFPLPMDLKRSVTCGERATDVTCVPTHLLVNGVPQEARVETHVNGQAKIFVIITVAEGETYTVELPKKDSVGRVTLDSSDETLIEGFARAKERALRLIRSGNRIRQWYVLKDGEDSGADEQFCARELAHASTGAQVLGLGASTKTMLREFAANIAEERQWLAPQCLSGATSRVSEESKDDHHFKSQLPGNFDLLRASYQEFLWTGDQAYLNDLVLRNFYDRTVTDFVRRWDHDRDGVMDSVWENGQRGIPSYLSVVGQQHLIGAELLAAQYAGYLAYANLHEFMKKPDLAKRYRERANQLKSIYNSDWWDVVSKRHFTSMSQDHEMLLEEREAGILLPYWFDQIPEPGNKTREELDLLQKVEWKSSEIRSYLPAVYYRYGQNSLAYNFLLQLMHEDFPGNHLPEVPFTIVGDVATGLMGIAPDASRGAVKTMSRLSSETSWATLKNVPVLANEITVSHTGTSESRLTNETGAPLTWKAAFAIGQFTGTGQVLSQTPRQLFVDDSPATGTLEFDLNGQLSLAVILTVKPGETRRVRRP